MTLLHRSSAALMALSLAAVLGACGDEGTDPADLDSDWALIQFQEGNASDPLVDTTMTLKAERVSGNGGVNDLTGSFKATDDGKITFKRIGSSRKAGPQEAMDQETRLLQSLTKATTFEIDQGDDDDHTELELKNELGQTVLVFLEVS